MMTVKHITSRGEEFIYPASHVNYVPASALNDTEAVDTVWHYDHDGRAYPLSGGTVFVMNEHGKTVSRYDVGAANAPIGVQRQNPPLS